MGWKEAYQEKANAQLKEWQEWIDQYEASPAPARRGKTLDHSRTMQRLNDCYLTAQSRLNELPAARGEKWEAAKEAVEQAMIDLKRALDESGAGQARRHLQLQTSRNHIYEPFGRKE
jgi:hypothetical protein